MIFQSIMDIIDRKNNGCRMRWIWKGKCDGIPKKFCCNHDHVNDFTVYVSIYGV